jgi:hypothetical protein
MLLGRFGPQPLVVDSPEKTGGMDRSCSFLRGSGKRDDVRALGRRYGKPHFGLFLRGESVVVVGRWRITEFSCGTGGFNTTLWPAGTNRFTVRWFGKVQAPYDGQTYTFYVKSGDRARLRVNGQLVIGRWATGSVETQM